MKKLFFLITICFLLFYGNILHAQELRFNQVLKNSSRSITDFAQDKQGVFWLSTFDKGLQRYDGVSLKSYANDPRNLNSVAAGAMINLHIDADNIIWMAMIGSGLERFDPATKTSTHYRHKAGDISSLSNDTVT